MPSPDLTGYTDLTLFDRSPSELVERALLDAGVKLPSWQPRDGNTEVVLMEALALEVAEMVFAINRVPSAVVEVLLKLYDVQRSLGTPATATATFTVSATDGYELPAGTAVLLPLATEDPLQFTTDVAATVSAGTVTVAITASRNTSAANGIAAGTELVMVTAVPYVDSVALGSAVTAGTDPETDSEWLDRGIQRLSRLVTTLVLPEHFTAYALEDPTVYRALTIDNYDGTATNAGHVTVAVLGTGGAVLSAAAKTALESDMDSRAQANLAVHVIDPTVTAVTATVTVKGRSGYTTADVQTNVTEALDAYLSPDTWDWGGTVRRNELIAVIDAAEGVDYVVTLDVPAADVTLAGAAPLADLGVVTVTVT